MFVQVLALICMMSQVCSLRAEMLSEWRQHSLGYVEVEHEYIVAGPIINDGHSTITVPANSGEMVKRRRSWGRERRTLRFGIPDFRP